MTQYEMTENLSGKMNITLEEAKSVLEASDWNMLTATHHLDQERFRRMQALNEVASSCEAAVADGTAGNEQPVNAEETKGVEAEKCSRSKAVRNLGEHIRRLVAFGNRNRLVVRRGDAAVVELPVTVLALLLIGAFWACAPLFVIGLFAGCRYSFKGQDLDREGVINA